VLAVTRRGFAKRTPIAEFSLTTRTGNGVIGHKLNPGTGASAGALTIGRDQADAKAALNTARTSWVLDVQSIPQSGRSTQGRCMTAPDEESPVGSVTLLWSDAAEGNRSR